VLDVLMEEMFARHRRQCRARSGPWRTANQLARTHVGLRKHRRQRSVL